MVPRPIYSFFFFFQNQHFCWLLKAGSPEEQVAHRIVRAQQQSQMECDGSTCADTRAHSKGPSPRPVLHKLMVHVSPLFCTPARGALDRDTETWVPPAPYVVPVSPGTHPCPPRPHSLQHSLTHGLCAATSHGKLAALGRLLGMRQVVYKWGLCSGHGWESVQSGGHRAPGLRGRGLAPGPRAPRASQPAQEPQL